MSDRRRGTLLSKQDECEEDECSEEVSLLSAERVSLYPVAYDYARRKTLPVPSLTDRTAEAVTLRRSWRERCNDAMGTIASYQDFVLDTRRGRVNVADQATLRLELLALNICESVIVYLPGGGAHHLMCVDEARVIWVHARTELCVICRAGARVQL
jgi:hypothetical protein